MVLMSLSDGEDMEGYKIARATAQRASNDNPRKGDQIPADVTCRRLQGVQSLP